MINEKEIQLPEVEEIEAKKVSSTIHPKRFQQKYLVPHLQSYLWDQALNELIAEGKYNQIRKMCAENAEIYLEDHMIMGLINAMGTTGAEEKKTALFNRLKANPSIASIYIALDGLHIEKTDGTKVHAKVLSSTMPALFEDDDKILTSARKKGSGHYDSINLSTSLNFPSKVATGFTHGLTSRSRYLHSWVETSLDDEPVVIDYTMNAIINKEAYYELKKADVISKVSSSTLKEDGKIVYPYILRGELSYAEYLACRVEVLENIAQSEDAQG